MNRLLNNSDNFLAKPLGRIGFFFNSDNRLSCEAFHIVKEVVHHGLNMMTYFCSFSHDPENRYSLSPCGCDVSGFHQTVELIGSESNSSGPHNPQQQLPSR